MALFFVTLLFLLLAGLLHPVRVRLRFALCGDCARMELHIRAWFSLLSLRRVIHWELRETEALWLSEKQRKGKSDKGLLRGKLGELLHLQRLSGYIELGGTDKAALIRCAGVLRVLAAALSRDERLRFTILPLPDAAFHRVKLEGIFKLYPTQIIVAAYKRHIIGKRGKNKYAASNRKHHA